MYSAFCASGTFSSRDTAEVLSVPCSSLHGEDCGSEHSYTFKYSLSFHMNLCCFDRCWYWYLDFLRQKTYFPPLRSWKFRRRSRTYGWFPLSKLKGSIFPSASPVTNNIFVFWAQEAFALNKMCYINKMALHIKALTCTSECTYN